MVYIIIIIVLIAQRCSYCNSVCNCGAFRHIMIVFTVRIKLVISSLLFTVTYNKYWF